MKRLFLILSLIFFSVAKAQTLSLSFSEGPMDSRHGNETCYYSVIDLNSNQTIKKGYFRVKSPSIPVSLSKQNGEDFVAGIKIKCSEYLERSSIAFRFLDKDGYEFYHHLFFSTIENINDGIHKLEEFVPIDPEGAVFYRLFAPKVYNEILSNDGYMRDNPNPSRLKFTSVGVPGDSPALTRNYYFKFLPYEIRP